jgi:pimeloyl-ACP methyl ester carboxylesterase
MTEELQLRVHGDAALPTLIYLPGIHGDWTLIGSFRAAVAGRVLFVEFTYPRTLTWSLADYAEAVDTALARAGISAGWLLAESFGSQVAWPLLAKPDRRLRIAGIILAGGFVRHPWPAAVRWARRRLARASSASLVRFLKLYARYAPFRHRHAPETLADVDEFVARRTEPDRQAMVHRLQLIADSDWRPVAGAATVPVFALSGLADPVVPWPWVRRWLRRHCPACRGWRLCLNADHNVLGTAPRPAARQVLAWIAGTPAADTIRSP